MANWAKKPLWILLIFFMGHQGFSQIQNEKSVQFFNHLYNFEFKKADSIISTIDSAEQSSKYNFLKAHYMRWYHLPIHSQEDSILNLYNRYLAFSDDFQNTTNLNYTQISNILLSAENNYNQGNYYKAFQNGSIIYDLMKHNLETEPEQIEIKFLASLYHYYYQYYKAESSVYSAMIWFFKEGDKEIGLKWLEEIANQESVVRAEALIYLSHIYLRLENNPKKAFQYAEMLHQLYPDNLKFYELFIECSLAENLNNEHLSLLIQKLNRAKKVYFKKYGACYEAIIHSRSRNESQNEKVQTIEDALNFINNNGGGNHLSSLLYYNLFEITGDQEYLKKKNNIEVYKYILTGYSKDFNN